jgi:hypothetical protein
MIDTDRIPFANIDDRIGMVALLCISYLRLLNIVKVWHWKKPGVRAGATA